MRYKLIEMRKELKKTQEQVASDLGISRAFYGMIETEDRNPTLILAERISRYFGKDVEEIFFSQNSDSPLVWP